MGYGRASLIKDRHPEDLQLVAAEVYGDCWNPGLGREINTGRSPSRTRNQEQEEPKCDDETARIP